MSLIDPSADWPGDYLNPTGIATAAADFRKVGKKVSTHGATIGTTWKGLSASYQAPEATQLLSAINSVPADAKTFGLHMSDVATALELFAHEAAVIRKQVADIRARAVAFKSTIAAGQVIPKSHGYSRYGGTRDLHPKPVAWDQDDATREANNALIAEVSFWQTVLDAAENSCASSILAASDKAAVARAEQSAARQESFGQPAATAEPQPWGEPSYRKETSWDVFFGFVGGAAKAVVVHQLWQGVIRKSWLPALESFANPPLLQSLQLSIFDPNTLLPGPGASVFHPIQAWEDQAATYKQMLSEPSLAITVLTAAAAWRAGGFAAARKTFVQEHLFETNLIKGFTDWDDRYRDPLAMAGTIQGNIALLAAPGGIAKLAKIGGAAGEAEAVEAEAGAAARAGEAGAATNAAETAAAAQTDAIAETVGNITAQEMGGGSFAKFAGGVEEGFIKEAYPNGIPGMEFAATATERVTASTLSDLERMTATRPGEQIHVGAEDFKIPEVAEPGVDFRNGNHTGPTGDHGAPPAPTPPHREPTPVDHGPGHEQPADHRSGHEQPAGHQNQPSEPADMQAHDPEATAQHSDHPPSESEKPDGAAKTPDHHPVANHLDDTTGNTSHPVTYPMEHFEAKLDKQVDDKLNYRASAKHLRNLTETRSEPYNLQPGDLNREKIKNTIRQLNQQANSPAEVRRVQSLQDAADKAYQAVLDRNHASEQMGVTGMQDVAKSDGQFDVLPDDGLPGKKGTFDGGGVKFTHEPAPGADPTAPGFLDKHEVTDLYLHEAKGGDHAKLGTRMVDTGDARGEIRVQQGSGLYLNDIMHVDPRFLRLLQDNPVTAQRLADGQIRVHADLIHVYDNRTVTVSQFHFNQSDLKLGDLAPRARAKH